MLNPVEQGVLFLLAGGVGFALSRAAPADRYLNFASLLNVWISLPGIFLVIYLARGVLAEDAGIVTFSLAITLVLIGLLLVTTRGLTGEVRGSVVMNGAIVNAVNLPFPLLQLLIGSYSYAATFAATVSAVQIVAAKILQGHFGTGSGKGATASLTRLVPLATLGLGIALHYIVWPVSPSGGLVDGVDAVEDILIAFICFHFGLTLGRSLSSSKTQYQLISRPFLTIASFRVVLGPLLATLFAIPFGVGSPTYLQLIFEAAMPPAILNTVIAGIYGFDVDLAAKSTIILTPINAAEAIGLFYALRGF
jgi:predicted permease